MNSYLVGTRRLRLCLALSVVLAVAACGGDTPEKLIASAGAHMAKREYNTAIIELKNALEKDVSRGETRLLLGEAMLENGDAKSAEVELQKALDQKSPADDVIPLLARTYLATGQSRRLIDDARKLRARLTSTKARLSLQTSVANAYANREDAAQAEKAIEDALAIDSGYIPALLLRARMYIVAENLDKASATADQIIKLDPANADAWKIKGDLQFARNDQAGALASYRKVLQFRPTDLAARQAITGIYFSQSKLDDVAKELEAMTKVAPQHPLTLSVAAQMAIVKNDLKKARELSQLVVRSTPNAVPALLQAGLIDYRLNAFVPAEGFFRRALQLAPESVNARRWLALTYLAANEPARAVDVLKPLQDAIRKDPELLMLSGDAYMRSGDTARAEQLFAAANKLEPGDARKRSLLAVSRYVRGDVGNAFAELEKISASDAGTSADIALITGHLRRKEFNAALKAVDGFEKKLPGSLAPHEIRGRIFATKQEYAAARKSFERALQLKPDYFPAIRGLAAVDIAERNPKAAAQRFEDLVAADPKNAQALLALAGLKAERGATADEVATIIKKAVDARPDEAAPRLALIDFYLRANDPRKAVAAAQEAAASMPNRAEIQEMLGLAQQASGEFNQALLAFTRQAQLQPAAVRPHINMAETNLLAKKLEAAADSFRKALELQPDNIEAQRGLIFLDVRAGKGENALAKAREIQRQRPKETIGYVLEGDLAAAKKAWPVAASAYRAGLKKAPEALLATRLHGVLMTGGSKAEAERFAQDWIKDHPKDYGFQTYLAENAIARSDMQAAAGYYRGLLAASPDNPLMLNNLAWVSGQLKEDGAIGYAEKANTLSPGQPAFMDTLAMLLAGKGDTKRALELLAKTVELSPNAPEFRLSYARVLIQAGKKPEARQQLDQIAKLGDRFPAQAEVARLIKTL